MGQDGETPSGVTAAPRSLSGGLDPTKGRSRAVRLAGSGSEHPRSHRGVFSLSPCPRDPMGELSPVVTPWWHPLHLALLTLRQISSRTVSSARWDRYTTATRSL